MSNVLEGLGLPADQGDVPSDSEEPVEQPQAVTPEVEPEAPEEPIVVPEGAENPDAVKAAIQAERKRARDANARARDLQRQLQEREEQSLPLEQRVALSEQKAAEAELKALRIEVGVSAGLSLGFSQRLQGADRDSILADAQALAAELGSQPKQQLPGLDGGVKDAPPLAGDPLVAHNHDLVNAFRGLRNR